jgi:protein-tyrosine phosphatase
VSSRPLHVENPYYGSLGDYEETFAVIESSLPGLHEWVDERLAEREAAP